MTVFSTLTDAVMLGNPRFMSGANGSITRVVIHGTVSPCVVGGARNVARYFQGSTAGGLAHYVVDPMEIVGCCPEETKCAHAPPNAGSIGIELCDPQAGDPARWDDPDHQAMLKRAADLTADICARHRIPLLWRDAVQLRAGNRGITGHVQVAQAWHQSDHTDPRDMPVDAFMALVTGSAPPEDDLTPEQDQLLRDIFDRVAGMHEGVTTADGVYHEYTDKRGRGDLRFLTSKLKPLEDRLAAIEAKLK